MGFIVDILTSIYNGLRRVGSALTSLPALIISGCTGLIGSIVQLISSITGNNFTSSFYSTLNGYVNTFANSVHITGEGGSGAESFLVWVLGCDVAISWCVAIVTLIFEIFLALLVFFLVAVPAVVVPIFVIKVGIWLVSALLPSGWRPAGASSTGTI